MAVSTKSKIIKLFSKMKDKITKLRVEPQIQQKENNEFNAGLQQRSPRGELAMETERWVPRSRRREGLAGGVRGGRASEEDVITGWSDRRGGTGA